MLIISLRVLRPVVGAEQDNLLLICVMKINVRVRDYFNFSVV